MKSFQYKKEVDMEYLTGYLIVVNIIAFFVYGIDKRKARKGRFRISEASLLGVAVFGGSVGAFLGMRIFRHKTRKPKFYIGVPVILILQALAAFFIYSS